MSACVSDRSEETSKLHVVATTGMLYDALLNIGGDSLHADYIMGPGVDPHLYKATQGDLQKVKNADLVIYNGLYLEGKMTDILKKLGQQKPVKAVAEAIPPGQLMVQTGSAGTIDPHVWFDVSLWKKVVMQIAAALQEVDPGNSAFYEGNLQSYLTKLDDLDKLVRDQLSEIPTQQRVLITAHDAFGYFGNAYGIRVEAVQGMSTVADFGLKDIAELIDLIISNNVKAVFMETSVSDRSIKAVIAGCREKGHEVNMGGSLYSDAMGAPGTAEGTYIGMFQKNVETMVSALK
ncbi:MAG: zinc ABC transporter substrate-binding protein [Bacteroidota bacterium]